MQRADLQKFKLPDEPGVYIFKQGKKMLYIGKAASLRDRVRSYFSADLAKGRAESIVSMVAKADTVSYRQTDSVLEALILEANLIKQHQPPYNVASKDNKSFNYVVITKEDFPRVLLIRGRELYQNWNDAKIKKLFGPFPHGLSLQEALKIVRRIFPYRDNKCTPCSEQNTQGRPLSSARRGTHAEKTSEQGEPLLKRQCKPCFNRQIGLCPGVCTGEMSKEEYANTVRHISQLFSGNFQGLKRQLTKEMHAASKDEEFEKAGRLRRQCAALEHIKDVSLIKSDTVSSGGGARVEAFDVAHTAGHDTVAVMTVVNNGGTIKAAYRKFNIHTATNNDVAALCEALERRLNHNEWPLPRVFVVDGGIAQLRAAERTLKKAGIEIPVVGVVKNDKHQPEKLIGDKRAIMVYERDILLANSEAHRFGITWHRKKLRTRSIGDH